MRLQPIALMIAVAATVAGCARTPSQCEALDEVALEYQGDLRGKGTLRVEAAQDGQLQVLLAADVPSVTEDGTPAGSSFVQLRGKGTCREGTLRVVFAGSQDKVHDRYRVLGGSMVAVLSTELTDGPFGKWQIDLHDGRHDREQNLRGFWQRAQSAQPAPGAVASNIP